MSLTHRLAYAPEHPAWREAWPELVADGQLLHRLACQEGIPTVADIDPAAETFVIGATGVGRSLVLHRDRPLFWPAAYAPHGFDLTAYAVHGFVLADIPTGGESYGILVRAVLLRAFQLAGPVAVVIGSDDDAWSGPAWTWARSLVYAATGEGEPCDPSPLGAVAAGPPCMRSEVSR